MGEGSPPTAGSAAPSLTRLEKGNLVADAPNEIRYRTPGHRRRAVRQALDALRGSRRAILTTHLNADGDGAGCQIAMAAWMRSLGARPHIVNPTQFPDMFRFLLPDDGFILEAGSADARAACAEADLAVVLDTGEVPRIGRVKPMIDGVPTVVIDHHQPGEQPIGGISLRDADACATGELVYDLVLASGGPWPEATRNGIYVAILTDTGSFRFSNASPSCHRIVADLIADGVDQEELHRRVYGAAPLRRLRLLGKALETLEVDPVGVAWMTVPHEIEGTEPLPEDVEGIVDYPRSIIGVEVGLLFRRTANGGTKISFRSTGSVDVNALAREFGGGGHIKASGAAVDGAPADVIPRVVEATRRAIRASASKAPGSTRTSTQEKART
jgi:phosphoesterase RecJ-like protein